MKKILVFATALIFLSIPGQAQNDGINQTDFRKRFMFGVKGGLNFANVYDAEGDAFHADAKLGLVGGVFVALPLGRLFGIQPEVLYSQKGFRGEGMILGSNYQLTRTSTFIEVPLLFAFKPSEFISFLAGPNFCYLIQQKDVFGNTTTTIEQETAFENETLRKYTLGFLGGIDFTAKHMVIGARVGWDLQNNNGDGTSSTPNYKNVWYQATIGYRFYQH